MREDFGEFKLLNAMKTGANLARLKVRSLKTEIIFTIELELEGQEPFRIVGLNVEMEE